LNRSLTGAKANKTTATIVVHTASHKSAVDCLPLSGRAADRSWSHRIEQIAAATPMRWAATRQRTEEHCFHIERAEQRHQRGPIPIRHGENAQGAQQNGNEGQNQCTCNLRLLVRG